MANIDATQSEFNDIYQSLVLNPNQSLTKLLDLILVEIIDNDTVPTNLLRVSIKSLIKLFELVDPEVHLVRLTDDGLKVPFNPSSLIQSLINCQIDDHSNKIDQQELIWINILQLNKKIYQSTNCDNSTEGQIIDIFFKILDQRGFTFDHTLG